MRPDEPEVRHFLGDSLVAEVATLSRKGVPSLTPLWFVRDRGKLYMGTGATTLAVRNIGAHPDVVLLFDAERRAWSDRALRIAGRATVHHAMPLRLTLRFAMKYFLPPGAMRSELTRVHKWRLRRRYYAQGQGAIIEVAPATAEFVPRMNGVTARAGIQENGNDQDRAASVR